MILDTHEMPENYNPDVWEHPEMVHLLIRQHHVRSKLSAKFSQEIVALALRIKKDNTKEQ
jgi:hypothetical protein